MARRAAPGGQSSIILGGDDGGSGRAPVSANAFATGSNQNCGNFLTDRPSTGVRCAPGGNSTICLGSDPPELVQQHAPRAAAHDPRPGPVHAARAEAAPVSANAFATGSNQNCGNFLTDRPSTGVRCAPGGNSSLCLGSDPESQFVTRSGYQAPAQATPGAVMAGRPPPGGASTFVLG